MAEVDFSNARIEPIGTVNATKSAEVSLNIAGGILSDVSGNQISTGYSISRLINAQKQLMYIYQGTFTASGTMFYIQQNVGQSANHSGWKISNISFNSGDTYVFQINANLVCN